VVHDRVYLDANENGLADGTLCGADPGDQVSTAGSWEAGLNDARPGIIMLANPVVGLTLEVSPRGGRVENRLVAKSP
jgi:hypothetical protein